MNKDKKRKSKIKDFNSKMYMDLSGNYVCKIKTNVDRKKGRRKKPPDAAFESVRMIEFVCCMGIILVISNTDFVL